MKFFRESIGKKYIFFLVLVSVLSFCGYLVLNYFQVKSVSSLYVFWIVLLTLFIMSVFFYEAFFIPVMKIAHEVKLMLTGKEFKKIKPSSIDEIGVFTFFFNQISSSLEKIASDIENNKRLVSELDIAGEIQRDILPKESPSVEGLDIVANTISADEMGGDSFDVIQHKQDSYIYIGDVTGHGVPASLVMMMVNTLMTAFAENGYSMKEVITKTNAILREKVSSQRFMTLVMMRWNEFTEEMSWVGAGHEYILVYRAATKQVEAIKSGGIALKMSANIDHIIVEKKMEKLNDGDVVLLYTDGITEGKNPSGEMYEVERLIESLRKHGKLATASGIFDAVSADFGNFVLNAKQEDDVTLIVIKRLKNGSDKRVPIKLMINSVLQKRAQLEGSVKNKWDWDNEKMK